MATSTASLGLGQHVEDAVAKHHSEHTDKVNQEQDKRQSGRDDRKDKAESLGNRLVKMAQSLGNLSSSDAISSAAPEELDNGTLMYTHIEPIGTFEEAINAVCSAKYVNEGAVVSQLSDKELSPEEITQMGLDKGIVVNVSLHSHDEELDVKTEHQVHAGNLIDPDSILVPEEGDSKTYKIIGESDPRFAPIMKLVTDFFESDAAKISEDLASVA